MFFYPVYQKRLAKVWIVVCLCSVFPVFATELATEIAQAQADYQRGHFEPAIRLLQAALDVNNLKTPQRIEIMIQLASAYQALGLSQQALAALSQAEPLASKLQTKPFAHRSVLILVKLFLVKSDISLATRQDVQARFYADKSLALLPANAPILIRAAVLNNLGNVLTVEAYYAKAVKKYARCVELAQSVNDAILSGRALTNMAYAYSKDTQWNAAVNTLSAARQQFESVDLSYAKAFGLISVGELAQRIQRQFQVPNQPLRMTAYHALNTAVNIGKALENNRLISYAYGFLGQLYETAQRYTEALYLTRQAIFYAKLDTTTFFTQQDQASEILYRWQWQLGRLFKVRHDKKNAIEAYRSAVKSLQPIRQEMALGYRRTAQSFRERVGPVYFELADLLLQRAAEFGNKNRLQQNRDYRLALDTIELFKTAELQDYFQDDCVTGFQSKFNLLDKGIAPFIGVVYPIMLPDRTEILLSLQGGIQQFSVPITASRLKDEVNEFRFELQASDTNYFLPHAKRLYRWLIAPLEQSLSAQGVDTLIIVPDGVLRTIPFAALHDGKQFLISKYALVTTPGLTLTEFKSSRRRQAKILLAGLSESVPGYSALSSVRDEIKGISKYYKRRNTTQLLDKNFTVHQFAGALRRTIYSILHIASHGQFDSDPQKTFLLTSDGKLTVNQLSKLIKLSERRQVPLELLTLSACQTAVGDDQAALGLAGIALKAGARTALASLWFIDDKATTRLMKKFYQQWQVRRLSKAKALQAAQLYLLKDSRYRHPAYWAPFLLIGHWQ
jgi:CHAT domain-containing protein/lipopolysaccharide biosynthesis regulator YciM